MGESSKHDQPRSTVILNNDGGAGELYHPVPASWDALVEENVKVLVTGFRGGDKKSRLPALWRDRYPPYPALSVQELRREPETVVFITVLARIAFALPRRVCHASSSSTRSKFYFLS